MKRLFFGLLAAAGVVCACRAQLVQTTVLFTNAPSDGDTITLNGSARTWKTSVTSASTQIAIGGSTNACATNLYLHLGANPIPGLQVAMVGAPNVRAQGVTATVTESTAYAVITSLTLTTTNSYVVTTPLSVRNAPAQATNIASLNLQDVNDYATNSFRENSTAVANLIGLTNAQTIAGIKQFTNAAGQFRGIVTNSPSVSATNLLIMGTLQLLDSSSGTQVNAGTLTAGSWILDVPMYVRTNLIANTHWWYGNGPSYARITYDYTSDILTIGSTGSQKPALYGAAFYGTNTGTFGALTVNTNATVTGALTVSGGTVLANTNAVTGDLAFPRYPITTLANGNNAAVPVGTNVFIEVSGPTGAFTINGIAGGRDGKWITIINMTGQNMTIAYDSGVEATAANRIYTMTGTDRATTGNGAAMFFYSAAASRWMCVMIDP